MPLHAASQSMHRARASAGQEGQAGQEEVREANKGEACTAGHVAWHATPWSTMMSPRMGLSSTH